MIMASRFGYSAQASVWATEGQEVECLMQWFIWHLTRCDRQPAVGKNEHLLEYGENNLNCNVNRRQRQLKSEVPANWPAAWLVEQLVFLAMDSMTPEKRDGPI